MKYIYVSFGKDSYNNYKENLIIRSRYEEEFVFLPIEDFCIDYLNDHSYWLNKNKKKS